MVYQHPWYVSSAPHYPNGRLGVVFISHAEKVAVGDEVPLFCYWPDAGVVLIGRVWLFRPLEPRTIDQTQPESGHLPPDASGRKSTALEPLCTRSDAAVLRLIDLPPASDQCC